MKRARLKNRTNISRNNEDIQKYKIQRNLVVSINREAKREVYRDHELKATGYEKDFWRTFKPLLSDMVKNTNTTITLVEKGGKISKM